MKAAILSVLFATASAHRIHTHHRSHSHHESPVENIHFNYYSNEKEDSNFSKYPNNSLDNV